MQHISLFSGIGGFELAAEWMGWQNIASCEINPFGRKVLEYYWPNSYHHDDIHTFTYEKIKDRINPNIPVILTGGFPCQPYSMAGKRKGKEDDRHLWPEMLRIIREIKPQYVVGENVLGIISWDGGLVFDEVHTDLEREGYEVQAVVIPAAAVNAPHGRDRVWFCARRITADPEGNGSGGKLHNLESTNGEKQQPEEQHKSECTAWNFSGQRPTPHTDSDGQQRSDCEHEKHTGKRGEYALNDVEPVDTENTNSNGCNNQDGEAKPCQREQRQSCSGDIQRICGETGAATDSKRYEKCEFATIADKQERQHSKENIRIPRTDWSDFPTQSPIRNGNDGLSTELDGITFSKWRNESIKAAGNAIVPQVAYEIFKAIQSLH